MYKRYINSIIIIIIILVLNLPVIVTAIEVLLLLLLLLLLFAPKRSEDAVMLRGTQINYMSNKSYVIIIIINT